MIMRIKKLMPPPTQNKSQDLNDVILQEDLTITGSKKNSDWFVKIFTLPVVSMGLSAFLMILLFGAAFFIAYQKVNKPKIPQNYEDCTKTKGSIIRESYPAVCVTKDKKEFIQPISEEEQKLLEVGTNNSASLPNNLSLQDWKTYRNEEYGVELKYPQDWVIIEQLEQNITIPFRLRITHSSRAE